MAKKSRRKMSGDKHLRKLLAGKNLHLYPTPIAMEVLGKSRSFVKDAVKDGRLEQITISGSDYILERSVLRLYQAELSKIEAVERFLLTVAADRQKTNYTETMQVIGLSTKNPPARQEIAHILARVTDRNMKSIGAMLSSLVHRKGKEPTSAGPGFFNLARSMDLLDEDGDEEAFLTDQMEIVWEKMSAFHEDAA